MRVAADRRSREISPAPAAERAAREAHLEIARAEVKAAGALAKVERHRSYVRRGFASVHAWAADVGYGPQQTGRLLELGRTLVGAPELEPLVRAGSIPAESAISIGRVLSEPALALSATERAAWLEKARTTPPRRLRQEAEKAIADARLGAPTIGMRFRVTRLTRDGFRRVRLLMSRGEQRFVSEGGALGRLVTEWLARTDPLLRPLPGRRSEPGGSGRSRHVSPRVRALLQRRSLGLCEVCHARRAPQRIHVTTSHAQGGSQEIDNLAEACRDCHVLVDAGVFLFLRFDESGHPRWRLNSALSREQFVEVRERAPPTYGAPDPITTRRKRVQVRLERYPRCHVPHGTGPGLGRRLQAERR